MKLGIRVLALALGLGLVFATSAIAQDTPAPPAKETAEPGAPPPAKEEPAKPAAEAAAKEEPAKPVAEPAPKAEAPKELSACAKSIVPLADSYKKAYDDLQQWIAAVDARTSAGSDKIQKLQQQIQDNETTITKAKLDGDDKKAKDLTKTNKQLWDELNAAKKDQSASCSGVSKEAEQRVKKYEADIDGALKGAGAASK